MINKTAVVTAEEKKKMVDALNKSIELFEEPVYYKIRFTHRGKEYANPKLKANSEGEARQSIIELCRIADLAKGKNKMPTIISVVKSN